MSDAAKLPYFPFYLNDWETSSTVKAMGPVARYYYLHLLMHQWREGFIPADRTQLKRLLVIPKDPLIKDATVPSSSLFPWMETKEIDLLDHDAILAQVLQNFKSNGRGRLQNPRLEIIRRAHLCKSAVFSASGKRGRMKQLAGLARAWPGQSESDTESEPLSTAQNAVDKGELVPSTKPTEPTLSVICRDFSFQDFTNLQGQKPAWTKKDYTQLDMLFRRKKDIILEDWTDRWRRFTESTDSFVVRQGMNLGWFAANYDRFIQPERTPAELRTQANVNVLKRFVDKHSEVANDIQRKLPEIRKSGAR